jgi:hypothetical protein
VDEELLASQEELCSMELGRKILTYLQTNLLTYLLTYLLTSWCMIKVKVKSKVVPVLFLIEYQAMKAYWGVEV